MVFIYAIKHPISGEIVYIGKTINPKERFRKHLSYKRRTKLRAWISRIKGQGLVPVFDIIDTCDAAVWQDVERMYIRSYRALGLAKLNDTDGGDGGATMLGRNLTESQKQKISKSNKGRSHPFIAKYNKSVKGFCVDMFDMDWNYIMSFESIKDAAKHIGRSDRRIQKMCKGDVSKTINHVGGYRFRYSNKVQAIEEAI